MTAAAADSRLYVLAQKRTHAHEYIRARQLEPKNCRVITCSCEMRGVTGFRFVVASYPGHEIVRIATQRGTRATDIEAGV